MTIGQMMLGEFDQEMQSTRKTLERVPDDKWNWKPHEKSGTVGWLASHVATMVGWLPMTINTREFDYAPVGGPVFEPPKIGNRKELLAEFDKNVAETRSEEHTSELQSRLHLVCRLLLEKKKKKNTKTYTTYQ